MKAKGILNKDLCALIGELGHGDVIIVCDAGFAIPNETWRIELALEKDSLSVNDFYFDRMKYTPYLDMDQLITEWKMA